MTILFKASIKITDVHTSIPAPRIGGLEAEAASEAKVAETEVLVEEGRACRLD